MRTLTVSHSAWIQETNYWAGYRNKHLYFADNWKKLSDNAKQDGFTHYKLVTNHINTVTVTRGKL